jgi:hypothetical protein
LKQNDKIKKAMSTYNINFKELFKSTFHYNIGFVGSSIVDSLTNSINDIEVLEEKTPLQLKSQTGAPVWDYVKLLPKIIEGSSEKFEGYQ